jgi:hypothetical protein
MSAGLRWLSLVLVVVGLGLGNAHEAQLGCVLILPGASHQPTPRCRRDLD